MLRRHTQNWIAIARNPTSGSGAGRRELLDLVRSLRERGFFVRIFSNREKLISAVTDESARPSLKCIVGAGGDGTIAWLINHVSGIPIATLPLGTENLFAKHLGISRSGKELAVTIEQGITVDFDIGEINGQKFLLMVSAGFDADVVHRLDARRTGNISKSSYLQPIWESWRKYPYPELTVVVDEGLQTHRGRLAMISNLPCYAMQLPFARTARADDGLLDLRLFRKGSRLSTMSYLAAIAAGRHELRDDVLCLTGRSFQIESEVPVPVQSDGDPCGMTPITVKVSQTRNPFIVPAAYRHHWAGNQP